MPPKNDLMLYKEHRLKTFHQSHNLTRNKVITWSEINDEKYIDPLVESGFYFAPRKSNHTRIQCSYCNKPEVFSKETDISTLPTKHYSKNRTCLSSLVMLSGVVRDQYSDKLENMKYWKNHESKMLRNPLDSMSIRFRLQFYGEKFPLDGLEGWGPNSDSLSNAGFIYSPLHQDDDRVICIYCGCSLEGWEKEDIPIHEHETNSSGYCYFLEEIKQAESVATESSIEEIEEIEEIEHERFGKSLQSETEGSKDLGLEVSKPIDESILSNTKKEDYFGILSSDDDFQLEKTQSEASDAEIPINSNSNSSPREVTASPKPLEDTKIADRNQSTIYVSKGFNKSQTFADAQPKSKSRKLKKVQAENDPNDVYWNKLPDTELFDELMGVTLKSSKKEKGTAPFPQNVAKDTAKEIAKDSRREEYKPSVSEDGLDNKSTKILNQFTNTSKKAASEYPPQDLLQESSSSEEQEFEDDDKSDIETAQETGQISEESMKESGDNEEIDDDKSDIETAQETGQISEESIEESGDNEEIDDVEESDVSVAEEGSSFREENDSDESFDTTNKPILRRSARTRSRLESVSVEPRDLSAQPSPIGETRTVKGLSDSYDSDDEFSFSAPSKKRKTQTKTDQTESISSIKKQGLSTNQKITKLPSPIHFEENAQRMSEIYSPNRKKSRKLKVVINHSPQQNDLDNSNQLDDYGEDNVEFLEKQIIINPVEDPSFKKVENTTAKKIPELSPIKLGKLLPVVDNKSRKRNIESFDLRPSKKKPNIFDISFENDIFNMKATPSNIKRKKSLEKSPSPFLSEYGDSFNKPQQFKHSAEPVECGLPPDISVSTDIEDMMTQSQTTTIVKNSEIGKEESSTRAELNEPDAIANGLNDDSHGEKSPVFKAPTSPSESSIQGQVTIKDDLASVPSKDNPLEANAKDIPFSEVNIDVLYGNDEASDNLGSPGRDKNDINVSSDQPNESDISESIYANYIKDIKDINDELSRSFDANSSEEEYVSLEDVVKSSKLHSPKNSGEEEAQSAKVIHDHSSFQLSSSKSESDSHFVSLISESVKSPNGAGSPSNLSEHDDISGSAEAEKSRHELELDSSPISSAEDTVNETSEKDTSAQRLSHNEKEMVANRESEGRTDLEGQEISDSLVSVNEYEKPLNIRLSDVKKTSNESEKSINGEEKSINREEKTINGEEAHNIEKKNDTSEANDNEHQASSEEPDIPKSSPNRKSNQNSLPLNSESEHPAEELSQEYGYESVIYSPITSKGNLPKVSPELNDFSMDKSNVRSTGKFSGNFSGLLEASTPNKRSNPTVRSSWAPQPFEHLLETLTNMEETSNDLKELTKSTNDLHDDYDSQLTNFISAMPENEENMTIQEWIRHSAATSRNIVKEYSNEVIAFYQKEYKRALEILESLPTE